MFLNFKIYLTIVVLVFSVLFVNAQKFYNKDINALIKIEKKSEFTTFSATAQNLTYSGVNLRYEFIVFKTDTINNVSKSLQSNRFFLEGNEKKILSSITLNNNVDVKTTLLLLIYPIIDGENNVGAIGKDRIVLSISENGQIRIELDPNRKELKETVSLDVVADGEDGVLMQGLVIQKTLTKAGRDFHRYFYAEYFNKQIKTNKHILIHEVPGQRRSTRISVKVDGQLVWQFFANPKKEFLIEMANTAIQRSLAHLQRLQQQQQQKEIITRY
ncbi:CsgE family curli-type amyloid fiber assembly protein [Lacinutrix mariniflava]|uniref:CsgE family curli-type amyloid fiber assembly protein n=1 Tax=Lacinutrix mariniflava TaxID=342955 RepID=UPI0006E3D968|nr:CsgE family curli-type amyloid fiber assembly protein [Lacinutrix mariniflava]